MPLPPSSILDLLIPNRAVVGDRILHYRIEGLLGEGGMGCVFEAFDERLERSVALKVLKPHLARRPEARGNFLREAKSLASVRNQNVVTVFAVEDADLPYIVMERLEGATLAALIESQGIIEAVQAVDIACQIASGLAAAHAAGVVHRDIKPHNVVLEQGVVKLLDFGLSVSLNQDLRSTGVAGTPYYIAPEQARDEPVDERTDLYALGVVLYRLLTGSFPFGSVPPSAALVAVTIRDAPSLASCAPAAPAALVEVVDRLLARDPDQRIQSACEVEQRLKRVEAELRAGRWDKAIRAASDPRVWLTIAACIVPFLVAFVAVSAALPPRVAGKPTSALAQVSASALQLPSRTVEHQILLPNRLRSWRLEPTGDDQAEPGVGRIHTMRHVARFDISTDIAAAIAADNVDQRILARATLGIAVADLQGGEQLRLFLMSEERGSEEGQRQLLLNRSLDELPGFSELGGVGKVDQRLAGDSLAGELPSLVLADYLRNCSVPCTLFIVADTSEKDSEPFATLRLTLSWQSIRE